MSLLDSIKKIIPASQLFQMQQWNYKRKNKKEIELIRDNVKYKNIHRGERCFILANGPSIKKVDLSQLAREYTFTVNQMSRLKNFDKLKTNYHMWADERFFDIDDSRPEDLESLEYMKKVRSEGNNPVIFYKSAAQNMIEKYQLNTELTISYFSDFCRDYTTPENTLEYDNVLPRFPTVVHYLILLAVYMGFNRIYLLGCDCTGIVNTIQSAIHSNEEMMYAYEISENERKRMQRSNTQFPIQDELRAYAKIFDDYELLDKYCKMRNVELVNLTEGSLLTSIKHDHLENILKEKN